MVYFYFTKFMKFSYSAINFDQNQLNRYVVIFFFKTYYSKLIKVHYVNTYQNIIEFNKGVKFVVRINHFIVVIESSLCTNLFVCGGFVKLLISL